MPPSPAACQTLTIAETAAVLGIGKATAYDLLRRHEFPVPTIRIGRRLVVSRRILDRLLDGGVVESPPVALTVVAS